MEHNLSGVATPAHSPGRYVPISSAFRSAASSPSNDSHAFSATSPGGSPTSPGRRASSRARPALVLDLDRTRAAFRPLNSVMVPTQHAGTPTPASHQAVLMDSTMPNASTGHQRTESNSVSVSTISMAETFGVPARVTEGGQGENEGTQRPRHDSFLPALDSPNSSSESDSKSERGPSWSALAGTTLPQFDPDQTIVGIGLGFQFPSANSQSSPAPIAAGQGSTLRPPPTSPIATVSEQGSGLSVYYSALHTPTTPFSMHTPSTASTATVDRFSPTLATPPPFSSDFSSFRSPSNQPSAPINAKPVTIPEEPEDVAGDRTRSPSIIPLGISATPSMPSPVPSLRSERSRGSRLNNLFRAKSRSSTTTTRKGPYGQRLGTSHSRASHSSDAAFELQEFGVRSRESFLLTSHNPI